MSGVEEKERLYYFDWLRVIAFSIILFEHSAEIFVDWRYWIKNSETSSLLTQIIAFFLPWRMPLLFIISGTVVTLSFEKKSVSEYLKERVIRLFFPLAFAIFFVIPPQLYFIQRFRGSTISLADYYQNIIDLNWNISTKGNIHFMHLWYLAYLLIYSVIFLPVLKLARTPKGKSCLLRLSNVLTKPYPLILLGLSTNLPHYFITSYRPLDFYKSMLVYYFPFFVWGVLLWSNRVFQEALRTYTYKALAGAMILTFVLYYFSAEKNDPQYYFLNLSKVEDLNIHLLKSLNQWLWLVGIFGLANRWLNFSSPLLSTTTKAVYPFYILHQTVIIVIGFFVIRMEGSIVYKLSLITLLSFFVIYFFYTQFIDRTNWLKLLFGVKPQLTEKVQESLKPVNIKTAIRTR